MSKVSKSYIKVQGIQDLPKGSGYGGEGDRHTDTHTRQYHDSVWPRGRAEWKLHLTFDMEGG